MQRLRDYWELTKPGVTLMVVISTWGGFYLAAIGPVDLVLLLNTLLGSWLVAAGTNAMNQLVERDLDAKMKRTRNRPLPAGRLEPTHVTAFAMTIAMLGIGYLQLTTNFLTALLAALTMGSYVLIYTPLKRTTPLSTLIGAVPGALPALGGWTAVRGEVALEAWSLFAILFFWQLPHFLAIAWIYREDYARGGFAVLPVLDLKGITTSWHMIVNLLALLSVSLLPTLQGLTGPVYFLGAFILGLIFLASGVEMAIKKTNRSARHVLLTSIAYLPVLFVLMFVDKVSL